MEEELNSLIDNNKLVKTNKGLMIKDYYIDILRKFDINVDSCSSYDEILYFIDEILNTEDLDDEDYELLDSISNEIAEIKYYNYTNK